MIDWMLVGDHSQRLDARLLPLLEAVDRTGSLAAGVAECGFSYRAAWGLLKHYESLIGGPLVRLERGRGARLTPLGVRFVEGRRAVARRLEPTLAPFAFELEPPAAAARKPLRLRIAASHDLVLASLATMPASFGRMLAIEPTFMGSLPALEAFAGGKADAAGFHVPSGKRVRWDPTPFCRILTRGISLLRFIDRDQGLMLPRGNPAGVRSLAHIARKRLRFVNRQAGSGTRLLVDALLTAAHLSPADINGYAAEEFTHGAVAATVASGGADAGLGLRAAAAEYGLDFVPLVREHYLIAIHSKDLERPATVAFRRMLSTPEFAEHVRRFPGCTAPSAGVIVAVEEVLDA